MRHAHIVGWGSFLPQYALTNDQIAEIVDTNDEWIVTRTGIRERRIASPKETTATLGFKAATQALAVAGITPSQVDLIIVATSTPDHVFPSAACLVQDLLGASKAGAFDLSAACSGFVYGLSMAANAIATGSINTAIVIGAETMSRIVDWSDRATCILFGDGAGAVVLQGSNVPGGVLSTSLRSDGSGGDLLRLQINYDSYLPHLGPEFSSNGHGPHKGPGHKSTIEMNGRQVFRFATSIMADIVKDVLDKADLDVEQVSLVVPHQANERIISTAAKKLKMPIEKFHMNLEVTGNTSAASIPLALCDAIDKGRIRPDDNIVFVGFGGGLTWAAAAIKWLGTAPETGWRDREWKRARYVLARGRSRMRRLGRRVLSAVGSYPLEENDRKEKRRQEE
ncbi:MAG: ketoacyl-ACP synthase III [Anaerolineales bacterium]|nr:ketoacyl-ACP synthase III [Anaerolineales bacterium]MCB8960323.1 ketoacyl-ACP synthase III [Ardenticatenales bacterium]